MKTPLIKLASHFAGCFVNLIYPPLCIHCQEFLSEQSLLFCGNCLKLLELINPKERCPFCFSTEYSEGLPSCSGCKNKQPLFHRLAAAFDYFGPPATLVKKMKYGNQPSLAEGAAAYLALQFLKLEWPQPDFIIPVPISFTHWLNRGFNQSLLLAKVLAKILQCPMLNVLNRKSKGFSQAGLSYQQRAQLDVGLFSLKKKVNLQDCCLLLIDDVMTTGSTLRCCAEVIYEQCPASVYGLTLCRAIT